MKMKYLIAPIMFLGMATQAMANDCSVDIDSNDAMMFDKNEIVIDKSCKEFTVNLTHSGTLARNVMGHNVVISQTADALPLSQEGMKAGLENHYVPANDERVIAYTEIIGGGEKTSVTFDVNKLKEDGDYTFFCSFPGHISLMRGEVILK